MENIGEKIFTLRKDKGVSQEKLAESLNVARFTVSRWETNTVQPTSENINGLCAFFGVPRTYFFENSEENAVSEAEVAVQEQPTEKVKKVKFKNLKIVSVVVGIVLSVFFVIACGIAAYVTISPGSGGEWGNDEHIINYEGIAFLVAGTVAVAVFITVLVLMILKNVKKKKRQ